MSDDKVRLWRAPNGTLHAFPVEGGVPYIARPVADDDAREERLRVAEQQADALVKDRGEMLARAEKAEAQRDAFINGREMQRARADEATRDRDERDAMLRAAQARAERAEAERDEARKALAGHLFDGESLSLREAIRSEMLKDYARAINAHDAATARATKAEAERDRTRECLDSVQRNYDGDTAYISKAVTEAGFTFCTTESQPEHAIEIVSAIEKLKAERDSARALLNALRLCFDVDTPSGKATLARIDAESAERDQGAEGEQAGGGK